MALGVSLVAVSLGVHETWRGIAVSFGFMLLGAGLILAARPVATTVVHFVWPASARPMTDDQARSGLERIEWGYRRFRARHEWNPGEGLVYLWLDHRDDGIVTTSIRIRDPKGHRERKGPMAASDRHILVRYPADFREANEKYEAAPAGRYSVRWIAAVEIGNRPRNRVVARLHFRVSKSSSADNCQSDQT
jgi:hypothetical protein